jgi:putative DNA primase/helicase
VTEPVLGPAMEAILCDLQVRRSEAGYQSADAYCVLCGRPTSGDRVCPPCLHGRPGTTFPVDVDVATSTLAATDEVATSSGLSVVTLDEFIAVEELGAAALLGNPDEALIPEDGDVMIYGDGGVGKTTLAVDLACHLAAGDDWLGISVPNPVRALLVENEGPRALFRAKLRRKRDGWTGSPLADRVRVLDEPWARLTFAKEDWRQALAATISDREIDVVILGPVTRSGMEEAGTLQEVRDFSLHLADVRRRTGRPVAFVLVHHENKGGKVSGAWEGAGDTLLHVQAQGHARLRLYVQKARWSTSHHATALQLSWTDGEGFAIDDEALERDDNTIADELLAAVLANGGASWNTIEKEIQGKGDRKRAIRDRLLDGRRLINAGGESRMKLWHAEDPACPPLQGQLRPDGDALGTHPASATGGNTDASTASLRPDVVGTQDAGTQLAPPSDEDEE